MQMHTQPHTRKNNHAWTHSVTHTAWIRPAVKTILNKISLCFFHVFTLTLAETASPASLFVKNRFIYLPMMSTYPINVANKKYNSVPVKTRVSSCWKDLIKANLHPETLLAIILYWSICGAFSDFGANLLAGAVFSLLLWEVSGCMLRWRDRVIASTVTVASNRREFFKNLNHHRHFQMKFKVILMRILA